MLAILAAIAVSAPLTVHVLVKEERTSWQPIEPDDVERTIGQAALEALTKSGQLKLVPISEREALKNPPEYLLRVSGRMLDEAETHSVYLSFEPRSGASIGSLRTANTVNIGKQAKATMLQKMEQSAKTAASALWDSLAGAINRSVSAKPIETQAVGDLPWKWAEVVATPVKSLASADDLYSKDSSKAHAALRELGSLALQKPTPRHALEACVLKHPNAEMRHGCLVALAPLARRYAPTQRIVIEAFRKDSDSKVVQEANEQMLYFTGLSQSDAIAAWMERAAQAQVIGPMSTLGDQPNLDLVIVKCLLAAGSRPKYQRSKSACIEMLKPVPHERAKAIIWPFINEMDPDSPKYLEGAGEREGSIGTDWQRAVEALLQDAPVFPKGLDDVLWRRYERTLSSFAIDALADHAPPSALLANRFLEVIQTAGGHYATAGLKRMIDEDEKLRPAIADKLAELLATEAYHKSVNKRELEDMLKRAKGEKR